MGKSLEDLIAETNSESCWGVIHAQPMCPPEAYTLKQRMEFLRVNPHAFDPWYANDPEPPLWLLKLLAMLSMGAPFSFLEETPEPCLLRRTPRRQCKHPAIRVFVRLAKRRRCRHGQS